VKRAFVLISTLVLLGVVWARPASAVPYTLTVSLAGTGSGSVTSSPAGISCPPDCSEAYEEATVVTLSAAVTSGYFAGWSGGGCSGTGVCAVTISADTSVTATFNLPSPKQVSLRVSDKVVDEGGRVTFKAKVKPCAGHQGDQIRLKGGGKSRGKASNSQCTAKWRLKMTQTARFQAISPQQDDDHLAGKSKRIRVRVIPKPQPSGGGGGGGGCDPSYPTVCIKPPPPDLDCGDIPHTNFKVVGSDPHGFDGDNDGVGCETR
jgi:hypothetical protein